MDTTKNEHGEEQDLDHAIERWERENPPTDQDDENAWPRRLIFSRRRLKAKAKNLSSELDEVRKGIWAVSDRIQRELSFLKYDPLTDVGVVTSLSVGETYTVTMPVGGGLTTRMLRMAIECGRRGKKVAYYSNENHSTVFREKLKELAGEPTGSTMTLLFNLPERGSKREFDVMFIDNCTNVFDTRRLSRILEGTEHLREHMAIVFGTHHEIQDDISA